MPLRQMTVEDGRAVFIEPAPPKHPPARSVLSDARRLRVSLDGDEVRNAHAFSLSEGWIDFIPGSFDELYAWEEWCVRHGNRCHRIPAGFNVGLRVYGRVSVL
jgi:hypothetical protein